MIIKKSKETTLNKSLSDIVFENICNWRTPICLHVFINLWVGIPPDVITILINSGCVYKQCPVSYIMNQATRSLHTYCFFHIHVNKLFIALLLIHVYKTNSSQLFFFQSFSKEILKEVGSMNRDEFTNCYTNCYICLWYEQHFSLNTLTAHTERTLK